MLRFASSPTSDMHIGSLRIALLNYIVSQQKKEDFIVRIEDTDTQSNIEGKDQEILDVLSLFNINYTQVIYQSQNHRFHSAMALQLLHEKKAFSCFCSPAWIEGKRQEAEEVNKLYLYDDACRNLPAELVIDNTNPFTVRITRSNTTIIIEDKIKGKIEFPPDKIDSFVILTQEKIPTYNFACAVDDMLNDISLIICDEKDLDKAPMQQHIRDSLKYDKKIEYAHIPAILDKDGNYLSDNENEANIKWLLQQGYLPEAIANYLISIGTKTPKEIFTMQEAVEWFDLSTLSPQAVSFDIEQLKKINAKHLKQLEAIELSRYVGFADAEIGELARIYLDEVQTTKELKTKIAPIFETRKIPKDLAKESAEIITIIKSAPYFESYDEFENHILQKSNIKKDLLSQILYILLTNTQEGPEIKEIYKYLKNYIGEIIK